MIPCVMQYLLQAAAQQQASASFYILNGTSLQPLATAYISPADPHKARLVPHPRLQSKPRFTRSISVICHFICVVSAY